MYDLSENVVKNRFFPQYSVQFLLMIPIIKNALWQHLLQFSIKKKLPTGFGPALTKILESVQRTVIL